MVRRISPAQFRSQIRQAQSKLRQSAQKFDQQARRLKSAINQVDREVRAHNARVQRNRQRLKHALAQLQRAPVVRTYTVYRSSTIALHEAYVRLERQNRYSEDDPRYRLMLELPQQENANNLALAHALLSGEPDEDVQDDDLESTSITDELSRISPDLHQRWHGALFALNPRNPDAGRHFCASAREIFTHILHTRAPDDAVFAALPNCQRDNNGRPVRRARIHFLLHRKGIAEETLEEFVDQNIDNLLKLFDIFNQGTHGEAGRFGLPQLRSVKRRVEDAIVFVTGIAD